MQFAIPVLVGMVLASCATRSAVRGEPSDAGVAATYTTDFDSAKTASRDALSEAGLTVREDGAWDKRWRIVASQGLSSGTLGRISRVVLEQNAAKITVRVVVRSKMDTREARAADDVMASDIQKKIANRLAAAAARPGG